MTLSPALRCSPGRELRTDSHRRGHSFENKLIYREKDDDLALFNEMQSRENEDFLLKSTDDFEDTFSTKLRYFSDYKRGISVHSRGESSDFLNVDGEKNDYDWLLTPPDTPLFPSLDDETTSVNLAQRGRPRSQPISISRSSTMENNYRSSRGSASPHRLSPSPRSGSSTTQSRGRPSSAPHYSPISSVRHASPSRRPSSPSSKPSTPATRSSSPTPRRLSTGSSSTISSSRVRGTSPIKTSRGNSASPKIRAWQSNIPGFSSDVPPNLRTSLADRPASYVRGSSPASSNSRDLSTKFSRQSMSPTASRSVTSSHSQDRDRFSSSKGSVASSGDEDIDSLQSAPVGSADRSISKRVGSYSNSRVLVSSKKPGRMVSSSSAPKRSFDYAMRQMDHRKTPQNMFRPLLSSVPSTTFYTGKASSAHRTMISRNSSITTSSNASSDQGTSVAIETEGSDHNQDDVASEYGKAPNPDVHDEIFVFDKVDELNDDSGCKLLDGSQNIQHVDLDEGPTFKSDHDESENFIHHGCSVAITAAFEALHVEVDFPEVDGLGDTLLCSTCGRYFVTEQVETDVKLCPDCSREDEILTVNTPLTIRRVTETSPIMSIKNSEDHEPSNNRNVLIAVPEFLEGADIIEPRVSEHEENVEQGNTCVDKQSQSDLLKSVLSRSLVEEGEQRIVNQQEMDQPTVGHSLLNSDVGQQVQHFNDYSTSKVDVVEGAGISILLLKRSSSSKGPVVQGRPFTASTIPYDDLLYARDSSNSMRSSIGHGSVSASSSVDLSSARQTDTRVQRQLSGRKSDMENYRYDINSKAQSTGSSCSGTSNHAYQVLGPATISLEGNLEVSLGNAEDDVVEGKPVACLNQMLSSENTEINDMNSSLTKTTILEEDNFESSETCRIMDASTSETSSHTVDIHVVGNFIVSFPTKDNVSNENEEDLQVNDMSIQDIEGSVMSLESPLVEEHTMSNTSVDGVNVATISAFNSLGTISEIEIENGYQDSHGESDVVSPKSKKEVNNIQESSASTPSDKKLASSPPELNSSNYADDILEEMTVLANGHRGSKARSLTLEEATDSILFCSSIVHNLAYQAATIAIEKEDSVPLEGSRPTVTILGKFSSDRKNPRGRTASKHSLKSHKPRQKRVETETKPPESKTENDVKPNEPLMRNVGLPDKADNTRPPKLESKCNCTIM